MKIYKCILSGDEVLCDNDRTLEVMNDVVFVVKGKYISIGGEDYGISTNVDEDAGEGATADGMDDGQAKVVDIVHFNRLAETMYDKKSYTAYVKGYMKKLIENLEKTDPSLVDTFKQGAQAFIKKVLSEFDEYQFFTGESMDPEGITVLAKWDGEDAYFYYFKDGLKGEKV
ncbi:IgE-dependent histamine-releasing factor [Perkinsela sp. CCAP 1560/4]|nr:IgE-dependent histamine-releasing factor [Perkinsela sp. CCAP 1560/4]|eukprot:KNH04185.1 IgE-dependent histamine-releasing factor [Perkinsela sp. CCAP 1560/4]